MAKRALSQQSQTNLSLAKTFDESAEKLVKGLFSTENTLLREVPFEARNGFKRVTPKEISEILKKLSTSSAPGPDKIPYTVYKNIHTCNPVLLTYFANLCLKYGRIPKIFKHSLGFILRKPGKRDYTVPKAYRCIALENTFSKILEHIIKNRLYQECREKNILHPLQMGGIPKKSVNDAILQLTTTVNMALDRGDRASALFLDVKGTFDAVDHQRLMQILEEYKVSKYLIEFVASFLTHHKKYLIALGCVRYSRRSQRSGRKLTIMGSEISSLIFMRRCVPLRIL
jgi:hypothetical protein